MIADFHQGVGKEDMVPDRRGEGGCIPDPAPFYYCAVEKCNINLGGLGHSQCYS